MESIRQTVVSVLPTLSEDILHKILVTLEDLGATSLHDLKYVQEADLLPVLKPIPARKLIEAWKNLNESTVIQSSKSIMSSNTLQITDQPTSLLICDKKQNQLPNSIVSSNTFQITEPPTSLLISDKKQNQSSNSIVSSNTLQIIDQPTSSLISDKRQNQSPNYITGPKSILPPDWGDDFEMPWDFMPEELIEDLNKGRKPSTSNYREFIRILYYHISRKYKKPGKKYLRVISKKIAKSYPASFYDEVSGYEVLLKRLVTKFENANKKNPYKKMMELKEIEENKYINNTSKRKLEEIDTVDPNSAQNFQASSQNGFLNGQTTPLSDTFLLPPTSKQSQEETGKDVKLLPPIEECLLLLQKTYDSQRQDINQMMPVAELWQKWPLLFTGLGFFYHFQALVGYSIFYTIKSALISKGAKIINFFKANKNRTGKIAETFSKYDQYGDIEQHLEFIIHLLLDHFGENSESLFVTAVGTLNTNDVENIPNLPSTPCLVLCDQVSSSITFVITIDKKIVIKDVADFTMGFCLIFAAFYVLNIEYPEGACATLEFVQRCFLGLNSKKGIRGDNTKKEKSVWNPKVLILLNKLMYNEWCSHKMII